MQTQDNFIIICAGDIGGARALMPIIESFQNYNYNFLQFTKVFLLKQKKMLKKKKRKKTKFSSN